MTLGEGMDEEGGKDAGAASTIKLTPWGVYFTSKGVPRHPNLKLGVPEDTQNSYKGVLSTPKKKLGCPL